MSNSLSSSSRLIVFEGGDRSGKTTQSRLLQQSIPGSILLRYPDRSTSLGHLIDTFLSGNSNMSPLTANLVLIASLWQTVEDIKRYLEAGKTVIMDRYTASCYVYSLLRGMEEAQLDKLLQGMPKPSITFFLDVDPLKSSQRGDFGKEIYDNVEYQMKVRQGFLEYSKDASWITIDASQSIEDIQQTILSKIH